MATRQRLSPSVVLRHHIATRNQEYSKKPSSQRQTSPSELLNHTAAKHCILFHHLHEQEALSHSPAALFADLLDLTQASEAPNPSSSDTSLPDDPARLTPEEDAAIRLASAWSFCHLHHHHSLPDHHHPHHHHHCTDDPATDPSHPTHAVLQQTQHEYRTLKSLLAQYRHAAAADAEQMAVVELAVTRYARAFEAERFPSAGSVGGSEAGGWAEEWLRVVWGWREEILGGREEGQGGEEGERGNALLMGGGKERKRGCEGGGLGEGDGGVGGRRRGEEARRRGLEVVGESGGGRVNSPVAGPSTPAGDGRESDGVERRARSPSAGSSGLTRDAEERIGGERTAASPVAGPSSSTQDSHQRGRKRVRLQVDADTHESAPRTPRPRHHVRDGPATPHLGVSTDALNPPFPSPGPANHSPRPTTPPAPHPPAPARKSAMMRSVDAELAAAHAAGLPLTPFPPGISKPQACELRARYEVLQRKPPPQQTDEERQDLETLRRFCYEVQRRHALLSLERQRAGHRHEQLQQQQQQQRRRAPSPPPPPSPCPHRLPSTAAAAAAPIDSPAHHQAHKRTDSAATAASWSSHPHAPLQHQPAVPRTPSPLRQQGVESEMLRTPDNGHRLLPPLHRGVPAPYPSRNGSRMESGWGLGVGGSASASAVRVGELRREEVEWGMQGGGDGMPLLVDAGFGVEGRWCGTPLLSGDGVGVGVLGYGTPLQSDAGLGMGTLQYGTPARSNSAYSLHPPQYATPSQSNWHGADPTQVFNFDSISAPTYTPSPHQRRHFHSTGQPSQSHHPHITTAPGFSVHPSPFPSPHAPQTPHQPHPRPPPPFSPPPPPQSPLTNHTSRGTHPPVVHETPRPSHLSPNSHARTTASAPPPPLPPAHTAPESAGMTASALESPSPASRIAEIFGDRGVDLTGFGEEVYRPEVGGM